TFMARQIADGAATAPVHGIGVDEASAIVIGKNGLGTFKQLTAGTGTAYIITGASATAVKAGSPLVYGMLTVSRLDADGQSYDFTHWCGTTTTYQVAIDGAATLIYQPADPYTAGGMAGTCGPIDAGSDGGGGDGGGAGDGGSSGGAVDGGSGGGTVDGGGGADAGGTSGGCRIGIAAVVPSMAWVTLAIGAFLALRRRRA
ncbi:MAG: hypothetical protein JWP87_1579, partial [Labilithrix sp.]|nr:hypothetical protein [Labilithrix sp.]